MVVEWKCTVLFDGKVWRWRAAAETYLGLSGTAETEEIAEVDCRTAVNKAVADRVCGGSPTRQFVICVDEEDYA